ncbi:hypothetical protein CcCBS67573_g08621 [Chytriomyces confervae]|uniref:HNH nuclease domain-containing protein n=1 Tax=Chytriomyces confervae TaxID=246404 RepID=A0A507EHB7_9FUNG|nr:hypothetical protein CcCBS67573_g08621 [Chytriomyces confervae]
MNQGFWVQYQTNQPVKIKTHQFTNATGLWVQTLFNVADIIEAATLGATRRLIRLSEDFGELTLHAVVDGVEGPALKANLPLSALSTGLTAETALIIKSHKELTAAAPPRLRLSDVSLNTANFNYSSVIAIYNSKEPPSRIISVPSGPKGRPWDRIFLFLQVVCGYFEVSNYTLKRKVNGQYVTIPVNLNSGNLFPGDYFIIPNGCDDLMVGGVGFPIVPTSSLKRKWNLGSPSSPSISKKPWDEVFAADDGESVTASDSEPDEELAQFRESVITRDSHCVVTREYSVVDAVHILAHSWWEDSVKESLPLDIRHTVSSHGGINNVRNGILLRRDLATSFDDGKFSFVFREGHFYFIAITTDHLDLDGVQLDENLRQRADGSCWWSVERYPHPELVEFHLRNSVFKHMRGSACETEDSDSESDVAKELLIGV